MVRMPKSRPAGKALPVVDILYFETQEYGYAWMKDAIATATAKNGPRTQ